MIKTLPFLLTVFLMIGCAGYKFQEVGIALETGKPKDAYTYLQKHAPKNPDIPHQFELGWSPTTPTTLWKALKHLT